MSPSFDGLDEASIQQYRGTWICRWLKKRNELHQHVSARTVCMFQLSSQEIVCSCEDWELTVFVNCDNASRPQVAATTWAVWVLAEVPCLLISWNNVHEITKSESPEVRTIFLCFALTSGFIIKLYLKQDRTLGQHSHDDAVDPSFCICRVVSVVCSLPDSFLCGVPVPEITCSPLGEPYRNKPTESEKTCTFNSANFGNSWLIGVDAV